MLRSRIVGMLVVIALVMGVSAWTPVARGAEPEACPPGDVAPSKSSGYGYWVNGNDKLPKLKRLFGEDTVVTLVVVDLATGEELLRIEDIYRANANLNELLGPGSYTALFYDAAGNQLIPSQDVDSNLMLKCKNSHGAAGTPVPETQESLPPVSGYASERIRYADVGGIELSMQLFTPDGIDNAPVIVWIHGGGFGPGGLNAAQGYEDAFTSAGYAIAAVQFRSVLDAQFPAQVEDIKGAIRYLRAHAEQLDIDPSRIFVLGTSSGGLLAMLVGTTGDDPALEGTTGGNPGVSSSVAGVVNLFGSVTSGTLDRLSPDILPQTYEIMGCEPFTPCPERAQLLPEHHLDANDPPVLILHGTEDTQVPLEGSEQLSEALESQGIPVTFIPAPGYGHDKDGILGAYMGDILATLDGWLTPSS